MSSPGNPWCLQLQVSAAVQLDICKVLLQVHQNFFFFLKYYKMVSRWDYLALQVLMYLLG